MIIFVYTTLILLTICHARNLISHISFDALNNTFDISEYVARLENTDVKTFTYDLDKMIEMLKELASFDFGRFMLMHQGTLTLMIHPYLYDN